MVPIPNRVARWGASDDITENEDQHSTKGTHSPNIQVLHLHINICSKTEVSKVVPDTGQKERTL